MKNLSFLLVALLISFSSCKTDKEKSTDKTSSPESSLSEFEVKSEQFADLGILRYEVAGFDQLTLQQKKLVYYLTQAGLAGRDIMYDQNSST